MQKNHSAGGMLMPGRRGYVIDAAGGDGWSSGSAIPENASYNNRIGTTPLEYKASREIDFTDGFESNAGDEFVAYITDGSTAQNGGGIATSHGIYRYGFNGKEMDDEIKGEGIQYDYGFRIYDARLGRFLSVDPLSASYPYYTPYQFAGNTPIQAVDLDGREIYHYLLITGDNGKPLLKYQGKQTRDFASWEWIDNKSPATTFGTANGDLIKTKTIRVWLCPDGPDIFGVGQLTPTKDFSSFQALNNWREAGFPQEPAPTPDAQSEYRSDALTTILVNEMYFRYDMSDGHFLNNGGDGMPDVSRLFESKVEATKETPSNGVNKQVASANSGKLGGRSIIVDENLSPRLVTELQNKGYNVKTFEKGTSDADIITYAEKNNAIVLTNNLKDFNKKGLTTFKVSENMKKSSEVGNVVKAIENVNVKANSNNKVIAPGTNVSLAENK
jgi:RHS repeat-associated protein